MRKTFFLFDFCGISRGVYAGSGFMITTRNTLQVKHILTF